MLEGLPCSCDFITCMIVSWCDAMDMDVAMHKLIGKCRYWDSRSFCCWDSIHSHSAVWKIRVANCLLIHSLFELNGLLLVSSDACLPRLTIELLSLESPPQVYLGAPCSLTLDMVRLIRFDSFHLLGVGNLIFKSGSSWKSCWKRCVSETERRGRPA
jgi:hypothetical protein